MLAQEVATSRNHVASSSETAIKSLDPMALMFAEKRIWTLTVYILFPHRNSEPRPCTPPDSRTSQVTRAHLLHWRARESLVETLYCTTGSVRLHVLSAGPAG